jgi:hypothetical protein
LPALPAFEIEGLMKSQPKGAFAVIVSTRWQYSSLGGKEAALSETEIAAPAATKWLPPTEVRIGDSFGDEAVREALRESSAWDNRPLVPGNWITLTGAEANKRRSLLRPRVEQEYKHVIRWTRRLRYTKLPFYDKVFLYEGEVKTPAGRRGIATFLDDGDNVHVLDGQSEVIHGVNAALGLSLDTRAKAHAYLRFFSGAIQGDEGTFEILESPQDLPWYAPISERPALEIPPLRLVRRHDGVWTAAGAVYYGGAVFQTVLTIDSSGMVQMSDDEPIASGLPAWRLNYASGLRYQER